MILTQALVFLVGVSSEILMRIEIERYTDRYKNQIQNTVSCDTDRSQHFY